MELIKQLLKGLVLLFGIAMLIGGGVCFIADVFALAYAPNRNSLLIILMWTLVSFVIAFCGYHLIIGLFNKKS